jgi:hypothetical protein
MPLSLLLQNEIRSDYWAAGTKSQTLPLLWLDGTLNGDGTLKNRGTLSGLSGQWINGAASVSSGQPSHVQSSSCGS